MSDNYSDCQCWLVEWGEPNVIADVVIAGGLSVTAHLPSDKLKHLNLQIGDEFRWNLGTQTATAVEMTPEELLQWHENRRVMRQLIEEYHESLCEIEVDEK